MWARKSIGPVIEAIKNTDELITRVELTETYQQNHTFRIMYQSQTKALSAALVAPVRKSIVANLKREYKAALVGRLD